MRPGRASLDFEVELIVRGRQVVNLDGRVQQSPRSRRRPEPLKAGFRRGGNRLLYLVAALGAPAKGSGVYEG